jgi:hypothetical protein
MLYPIGMFTCPFFAALNSTTQVTTAEILGLVKDCRGAAVADAKVAARNVDTNATTETRRRVCDNQCVE